MSICRCCGLLPHPFRRVPTSVSRSLSTSSVSYQTAKVPPARDWGSRSSSGGGDSSTLGKWARPTGWKPREGGNRSDRGDRGGWSGRQHGSERGDRSGRHEGEDRGDRRDRGGFRPRANDDRPELSDRRHRDTLGGFGFKPAAQDNETGPSTRLRTDDRETQGSDSSDTPTSSFTWKTLGSEGTRRRWDGSESARASGTERGAVGKDAQRSRQIGDVDGGSGFVRLRETNEESEYHDQSSNNSGPARDAHRKWDKKRLSRGEVDGEVGLIRGKQIKRDNAKPAHAKTAISQSPLMREKQSKPPRLQNKSGEEKKVLIPSTVTVSRLANIFGRRIFAIQSRMQRMRMAPEKQRPDYMLTEEEACDIALEFGFNPTVDDEAAFDLYPEPEKAGEMHPLRPPVVTIMGHVDHGKTTLLDALRNTAVAAGEAGGITQHIGAFSVPLKSLLPPDAPPTNATITFLDTPGHAAFTGMRARGASVTDIVVLVVAADDGVMPQTKEVIELVKAEGDNVGLVVAINKIDKNGVDLERVRSELLAENVYLEEDGGDVQSVKVSGLSRIGLDNLVETLSTLAELRDLRARVDGKAEGYVLESNVDRGMGRVATVLITRGTLKIGAVVVAGQTMCKVRRMTDHQGNAVKTATPGMPVVIMGWKDVPSAGDELLEAPNGEGEAKKVVTNRIAMEERKKLLADTEAINVKRLEDKQKHEAEVEAEQQLRRAGIRQPGALAAARRAATQETKSDFKELRLLIKGDVSGTVEAVEGSLSGIGNKEAGVKIVSTGVGEITESDVAMAEASDALIIGFNVPASRSVKQSATHSKVEIHLESVIYRLIETVRQKTAALLPPTIERRTVGEGTVIQPFTLNAGKKHATTIAGSRCVNGTINRADKIRLLRGPNRDEIYVGTIVTLKHLKQEVDEVRKGMECGIQIDGFDDFREGDEIVTFKTFEIPRKL